MKRLAAILILTAATAALLGCAGNNNSISSQSSTTPTMNSGNWLMIESGTTTSNGASYPFNATLRGVMAVSGDSVTGTFSQNGQAPGAYSGTVSGNSVALDSAADSAGEIYASTATIEPGSIILGTYNLENGYVVGGVANTSNGTIYGTVVPSLSGNWSGTLPPMASSAFDPTEVAASIVQSATASTINNFPVFALSGTVTLTNASCFNSGSFTLTIDPAQSYVNGDQVVISAYYVPGEVGFTWGSSSSPNTLDNPTMATAMSNGSYYVSGPHCDLIQSRGSLTKS